MMIRMRKPWSVFAASQAEPDWAQQMATLAKQAQTPCLKRFYQRFSLQGDEPLHSVPLVAMDFETTGLNEAHDEIISIGLVPFGLQRIYCRESAHWVVKPQRPLVEETIVLHGITHSDVQQAPDLAVIIEPLLNALCNRVVVAHYHQIERHFLAQALQRRLGEGIRFPIIDTLALESQIQQRLYGGWWDRLRGKRPGSVRLGQARKRYGLPAYQPHHALTDALATAELLQAQIAHHFSPEIPVAKLWQ